MEIGMTRKELGDEELAAIAKGGDVSAFGDLVRRYQDRVFGFMLRSVRDPVVAEDLAQDVFLKAFRGLGTFRTSAKFAPWLYRIGTNRVSDWLALEGRRRFPGVRTDVDDVRDTAPGTLRTVEARQSVEAVRDRIRFLPPDMQKAVLLRHMMGLSYADIAEVTGWPPGTVRTNLFRARARLKSFFDELTGKTCDVKK